MNAICCFVFEGSQLSVQAVLDAGLFMLFMNAAVAFCLNVAVVFLVQPPEIFLTIDWQNILVSINVIRCPQRYPPRRIIRDNLVNSTNGITTVWLHNRLGRINLLQTWPRTISSSIHETCQRREFRVQPISTIIIGQSWCRSTCHCRSGYG